MKRFEIPRTLCSGNLPVYNQRKEWGNSHKNLKEKSVDNYIKQNPKVLLDFIYESAEIEDLEELLAMKKNNKNNPIMRTVALKKDTRNCGPEIFTNTSTRGVAKLILEDIEYPSLTLRYGQYTIYF